MKLLFDQNLSFKLCDLLSGLFPESVHAGALGLATADDRAVWEVAQDGGYVLVSLDSDFAELAALRGGPPKLLWLRCGNRPTLFIADLLRARAEAIMSFQSDPNAICLEIY